MIVTHQEVATVVLTIPILIISVITLWFSVPKKAKITITTLEEADLTDLIFFISSQPGNKGDLQQPTGYAFQLHIAVLNLGDRKAIVSRININGFRNSECQVVHLPDTPERIEGVRWIQQSGWVNGQRHFQNINELPPYTLDGGDAVVIRFTVRQEINWSSELNLQKLKASTESLQDPIVSAFGTVTWRRADKIITDNFNVNPKVAQQVEYVRLIGDLTSNFTIVPQLKVQPSTIE